MTTAPVFLPGAWQNLLMEPLDVFTAQDLARRPEDLFRDAEQGKLALITKDGRPENAGHGNVDLTAGNKLTGLCEPDLLVVGKAARNPGWMGTNDEQSSCGFAGR